jgi:2-C-methyl-D-erythritol 4-phosphate cytidylyltransferase
MNIAIITSAGVGKRFGNSTPKQYLEINNKPVIEYVINAVKKAKLIDKIIIVASKEYIKILEKQYGLDAIEGGAERNISIRNSLEYIKSKYPQCKNIIIFDAVRPLIYPELIDKYMTLLKDYEVVATAQHIVDSLGCLDFQKVDRSRYYILQSPEAFRFKIIDKYHDENSPLSEVTQQFPADTKIYHYYGFPLNYKIAYPEDLEHIESLINFKKIKRGSQKTSENNYPAYSTGNIPLGIWALILSAVCIALGLLMPIIAVLLYFFLIHSF